MPFLSLSFLFDAVLSTCLFSGKLRIAKLCLCTWSTLNRAIPLVQFLQKANYVKIQAPLSMHIRNDYGGGHATGAAAVTAAGSCSRQLPRCPAAVTAQSPWPLATGRHVTLRLFKYSSKNSTFLVRLFPCKHEISGSPTFFPSKKSTFLWHLFALLSTIVLYF